MAIEPTGLDPCDLRLQHGPAAVRELVARRIPLYRFVMGNVIAGFDLDRAEGRTAAMRAAAPLVSSIRDVSLVNGYARELAGMIGLDVEEVRREVGRAASRHTEPAPEPAEEHERPPELSLLPDPTDRALSVERGTCQLLVQQPELFSPSWEELQGSDFTHPAYAALFSAVKATDATGRGGEDWLVRLRTHLGGPGRGRAGTPDRLLGGAAVVEHPGPEVRQAYAAKLRLLSTVRAIADLKSKLQRTNPVDQQTAYNQMFADLLVLENRRKDLQARSVGIDS